MSENERMAYMTLMFVLILTKQEYMENEKTEKVIK
jgi:hypothetical protein